MPHSVTWIDRLRNNLLTAARIVGTTEALRRPAGSRRLAEGYLTAELGAALLDRGRLLLRTRPTRNA